MTVSYSCQIRIDIKEFSHNGIRDELSSGLIDSPYHFSFSCPIFTIILALFCCYGGDITNITNISSFHLNSIIQSGSIKMLLIINTYNVYFKYITFLDLQKQFYWNYLLRRGHLCNGGDITWQQKNSNSGFFRNLVTSSSDTIQWVKSS